ncbi:MAG: hypothetical protein WBA12_11765 [Catalinimonas sp.]
MNKKKIFLIVSALFVAGVIVVTIDIFSRTSPPGSKKHLVESISPSLDSTAGDSALVSSPVSD